jgi:Protein of unknown function (DUF3025)
MSTAAAAAVAPFEPLRSRWLDLTAAQWTAQASALAAQRGIRSAAGAPIRFVIAGDGQHAAAGAGRAPRAIDYEREIHQSGRVGCRHAGVGAVHDLCNALVWLALPCTKATLNDWHVRAGDDANGGAQGGGTQGRGRLRDVATLLDESGLLWVSDDPDCDAALRERRWHDLFVTRRERLRASVQPLVVGHGLLQKLARPYKALTAHCLVIAAGNPVTGLPLERIDQLAAACLNDGCVGGTPPDPVPLPVMGLPGWCAENVDRAYFDDTRVFRPLPDASARSPRGAHPRGD